MSLTWLLRSLLYYTATLSYWIIRQIISSFTELFLLFKYRVEIFLKNS